MNFPPKIGLSRLVNSLKGVSSRRMRQEFPRTHRALLPGEQTLVRVLLRRERGRRTPIDRAPVHRAAEPPDLRHARGLAATAADRGQGRALRDAHREVADKRREFHHQLSTQIIRDNQAVYVEDLAVNGLARTHLAKSVHDAGWSAFVTMLEYKAKLYGRYFGKIGRYEPTSQVCSVCGVKDGPKPLRVRVWVCRTAGPFSTVT